MNCIYKISHPELKGCYIGGTINLRKRKYYYKSHCNSPSSFMEELMNLWEHNTFIFDILEEGLEELMVREQYYIELYDSIDNGWNEIRAHRTNGQRIEHMKKHNSEKIECECGCYISRGVIARHRKSPKHKRLMINML